VRSRTVHILRETGTACFASTAAAKSIGFLRTDNVDLGHGSVGSLDVHHILLGLGLHFLAGSPSEIKITWRLRVANIDCVVDLNADVVVVDRRVQRRIRTRSRVAF
jgi:hypothetical protein